ncbi:MULTISPECIES: nitrate- and nitrite sensing domain-containing protein [Streptomyces]|uniref:histidine kinase n=1 Tax=Streptomyces lonegramiae TaxID=3075524 RepID=A0ABU2XP74_9ACTN|nr:nitrate- and nitrite sensing domain-containing protein [Streptomyces sp. DSM 41529]MDT0547331.1 nitrate- and nitrite sensing domain-containing protein [Streptomyces sp. DSM 41529]
MRRSKPDSAKQVRGNFTPPPRTAAPPTDAPEPSAAAGGRLSPRNWRVPARLNAILLIPVLVALVFGGFRVESSVSTWNEAEDAERTARLVRAATAYAHALVDERDRTAVPLLTGSAEDEVKKLRAASDAAKAEFDKYAENMPNTASLQRRLKAFQAVEPQLANLRRYAYTDRLNGVKTEEGYVAVEHSLLEFANELGLGTGNITSYGRTVYAVSLAKGAESLQRAIGAHLLVKPGPSAADRKIQLTAFGSYVYLENIALTEFQSAGLPEDVARLKQAMAAAQKKSEQQVGAARQKAADEGRQFVVPPSMEQMVSSISDGAKPADLKERGITPASWLTASTARFEAYHQVEKQLVDNAVDEASQISANAKRDAFVNSAIVLLALLLAFVVAGRMARSMSRSMRQLRNAAFDVAEQRLPALVNQLSQADPGRVDTRIKPIPITTRDEIGEVARAFDRVHREATRLASEQAMLRGNVNAIFTNLSSRNQGLIERQLSLISDLENSEADPDQLEQLFRLDHLATRMRRNGENLLILAGEEPGRRWNQPVPLVDVLRAASSEVESYERLELASVPETEIHGNAVTDLVHLLAELLENATTFSSPHTKVRVTATRLPDGRVMIEIHDKGIGLTAEDFADINHKLANPPTVDATVSQRMGLYVVGRLADRHHIRVQLRPSGEQAGTTSLVMLPDAITHGGGGEELPGSQDFTVSPIVPEQASQAPQAPQAMQAPQAPAVSQAPQNAHEATAPRTAADFGFDDSAYGADPLLGTAPGPLGATGTPAAATGPAAPPTPTGPAMPFPPSVPYSEPEPDYSTPADPLTQPYSDFTASSHQGNWSDTGSYESPFGTNFGAQTEAQTESAPSAPEVAPESVEFHRPGPSPSAISSLTDAGLPRRERQWQPSEDSGTQAPAATEPAAPAAAERPGQGPGEHGFTDTFTWHAENDQRWHRAEQLREPKAGGITSSGLPRRVPKANLVEGSAESTGAGGPQISRAPEDIRGRLSNLRRGVQKGRQQRDQHDQQGYGPGSSYDQER